MKRERSSKTYRTSSYFFGRSIADIPLNLFFPVLFGVILYWMVGLNADAGRFFRFLLINIVMTLTAESIGQLLGAASPSVSFAQTVAPVVCDYLLLIIFADHCRHDIVWWCLSQYRFYSRLCTYFASTHCIVYLDLLD